MPAGRSSHKRLRGQAAWWGEQKIQDTNLAPELVFIEVTQTADGLSSATVGPELVVDGYPARVFSLQARRFRGYVTATSFEVDMCSRVVEGSPCAGLLQLPTHVQSFLELKVHLRWPQEQAACVNLLGAPSGDARSDRPGGNDHTPAPTRHISIVYLCFNSFPKVRKSPLVSCIFLSTHPRSYSPTPRWQPTRARLRHATLNAEEEPRQPPLSSSRLPDDVSINLIPQPTTTPHSPPHHTLHPSGTLSSLRVHSSCKS